MTDPNKPTETVQQIDDLLKSDNLTTRVGLRLSMSALRDAMRLIDQVDAKLETMEQKVNAMWQVNNVIKWGAAIVGASILALIWSLITGQASIVFLP